MWVHHSTSRGPAVGVTCLIRSKCFDFFAQVPRGPQFSIQFAVGKGPDHATPKGGTARCDCLCDCLCAMRKVPNVPTAKPSKCSKLQAYHALPWRFLTPLLVPHWKPANNSNFNRNMFARRNMKKLCSNMNSSTPQKTSRYLFNYNFSYISRIVSKPRASPSFFVLRNA